MKNSDTWQRLWGRIDQRVAEKRADLGADQGQRDPKLAAWLKQASILRMAYESGDQDFIAAAEEYARAFCLGDYDDDRLSWNFFERIKRAQEEAEGNLCLLDILAR